MLCKANHYAGRVRSMQVVAQWSRAQTPFQKGSGHETNIAWFSSVDMVWIFKPFTYKQIAGRGGLLCTYVETVERMSSAGCV